MVVNIIDHARDRRYRSRKEDPRTIMVHRVGIDKKQGIVIGDNAPDIVDAFLGRRPEFQDVAAATKRENSYTFYIGGEGPDNGVIWQATALSEVTYHARLASASSLGIACIGDFRFEAPTLLQWDALVWLCAELCLAFGISPGCVKGHGEVGGAHGGEKGPGRPWACPGDELDMDHLRAVVETRIAERGAAQLDNLGIVA